MSKIGAWMPLWIGDYKADTQRLTLEQHGAYLLLLMDYWRNGPPPDDEATLARILGINVRKWRSLSAEIAPFFVRSGGRLHHKRVDAELAGARERSGKAAAKAKVAATRRWELEREREKGSLDGGPSTDSPMPGAMPQAMHGAMPEAMLLS